MVFICGIGTMELKSLKMDLGVCRNLYKTEAALRSSRSSLVGRWERWGYEGEVEG